MSSTSLEQRFLYALGAGIIAALLLLGQVVVLRSNEITPVPPWVFNTATLLTSLGSFPLVFAAGYRSATPNALTENVTDSVLTFFVAGVLCFGVAWTYIVYTAQFSGQSAPFIVVANAIRDTVPFVFAGVAGIGVALTQAAEASRRPLATDRT